MLAAVVPSVNAKWKVKEVSTTNPRGNQVLIKMHASGRCYSDVMLLKAVKDMGMSDWHTNIILELFKLSRDGYLSSVSHAVEEVVGKKPRSFSQFLKDDTSDLK